MIDVEIVNDLTGIPIVFTVGYSVMVTVLKVE